MADAPEASGYDAPELDALVARLRPRHETAQELALGALREAILEGILPPGTRLRQEDLAQVFDTSRIPIREALRALEYEGLVASEPHRGFTVTGLDADQLEEIYDLRTVLESHAVRVAIPLLTQNDLDDLEQLFSEMQAADDDDVRLAKREQFYLRLYSVTARPRLVGSHRPVAPGGGALAALEVGVALARPPQDLLRRRQARRRRRRCQRAGGPLPQGGLAAAPLPARVQAGPNAAVARRLRSRWRPTPFAARIGPAPAALPSRVFLAPINPGVALRGSAAFPRTY